jgi:hypothetical protein
MPPAPARIASTPRQSSRTCWNPAVPPPPVPGGAVGNEPADGLGDGDGLGLGAAAPGRVALGVVTRCVGVLGAVVTRGVGVLGVVVLGVVVLGALLEVVGVGVPLAEMVGVARPVLPGENGGGVGDGAPPPQADTDVVASMAAATQPTAVRIKRRRP